MVFFELALGKGAAAAGLDIVRTASASGGVAAAAVFTPPTLHLPPLDGLVATHTVALGSMSGVGFWDGLTSLGGHLSEFACSTIGSLGISEQVAAGTASCLGVRSLASSSMVPLMAGCPPGLVVASVSATFVGLMKYYGVFDDDEEGQANEEAITGGLRGFLYAVPATLAICAFSDSVMIGALLNSIGHHLTVPLRTWALGGLLLSFPASWLVKKVVGEKGIRVGFVVEAVAASASFMWLAWGTMLLSSSPEAALSAPLLWWTCFVQCIFAWSWISCGIACMVLTTVLSVVLSGK